MASHTHLLARKRQGSLINSTSQAAFLTKMSRWYYGKREKNRKVHRMESVCISTKKEEREEKQKEAKKTMAGTYNMNPVTIPETGISSHSHLLIILRKDFSIVYY